LILTSDGGYAVAGSVQASSGEEEWLVKTDANGNAQWNQTYAASGDNYATSLIQTSDGGYALGGYTDATGAGGYDFYLIKTTSTGTISTRSAFNWDSLDGFLIIGAIIFIVLGVMLFIMAKTRKPASYSHMQSSIIFQKRQFV
jgi:predicted secreted protein